MAGWSGANWCDGGRLQRQRNAPGARIKWLLTTERARNNLARAYPETAKES